MNERPEQLAQVFVELADTLVSEFDVVEFLSMLTSRCVDILGASEVGVLLVDESSHLKVMAASSERMRVLELLEVQSNEGPCRDAFVNVAQVLNRTVSDEKSVWPRFAPAALEAGFQMVHAFPMRLRNQPIGALNVFQSEPTELTESASVVAQALADAATIGILQERNGREQSDLAAQLQDALRTRVVVEQAKGALAERLDIHPEDAFNALRAFARNNNLRLSEVAERVTAGELRDVNGWLRKL